MKRIPYSPDELKIVGEFLNTTVSFVPHTYKYNTPISVLENSAPPSTAVSSCGCPPPTTC